jgi:hypothetical protein
MTFLTRIPIEECKARLAACVDVERLAFSWSGYAGSKPMLGKLRDTNFRLQRRRFYRNSFAPFYYGRFVAAGRDTKIEGELRMRTDVKIFMVVWFSFLAVVFLIMAVTVLAGRANAQNNPALGIVIPAGMAVFGVALIKFGRWLGRGEERDIVAFLKSTFGASDAG